MREIYDVRLHDGRARQLLPRELGQVLGGGAVRRVVVVAGSPEFEAILAAVGAQRNVLFSWGVKRRYATRELDAATRFLLEPTTLVEPAGEECGTQYDESSACPVCGAGAAQRGALFIGRKALRGDADIRITIASEVIVSSRVRDLLLAVGVRAALFGEVFVRQRGGVALSDTHVQLMPHPPWVPVSDVTTFGASPFEPGAYGRCPAGDTAGLNRLTELTVTSGHIVDTNGIGFSDLFTGARRGLLRPSRPIVISRPVYDALVAAGVAGCRFEIVKDEP